MPPRRRVRARALAVPAASNAPSRLNAIDDAAWNAAASTVRHTVR